MSPRVFIRELTFNTSDTFVFGEGDVVLIVGPNNVGKSRLLGEIYSLVRNGTPGPILQKLALEKTGDAAEVVQFLHSSTTVTRDQPTNPRFRGVNLDVSESNVYHLWNHPHTLGDLTDAFCALVNTESRLHITRPAPNISLLAEPPSNPIHRLQRDDELEERFSRLFHRTFGMDLLIHRNAGANVPLYCGTKPALREGEDRISRRYIVELEKLMPVHEQGDSIRSFLGVLLFTLTGSWQIILVDEAEAFLHPPQARLLGRMLVQEKPRSAQLFCATHSSDFLQGIIEVPGARVHVIRMRREGDRNPVTLLDDSNLRSLWRDPLLRHSNIFDGLFHERVVICESDADCMFYSAVISAIANPETQPDLMFTHTGGKHRLPVVVRALKSLDVPLTVVVDFDVFQQKQPLRELFESLGGSWPSIEKDWKNLKHDVEVRRPEFSREAISDRIKKVLTAATGDALSRNDFNAIRTILRRASVWDTVKERGASFFKGDMYTTVERLLNQCSAVGMFIVSVGELESFDRRCSGHGPTWVNEVLTKDLLNDPQLSVAREFASQLLRGA